MNRDEMLGRAIERREPWDIVIIGGGAVGMGVAVDAASRGYDVLLVEQHDFGKGTSSRSTKLVHGGVRYLEQGAISLVMEALKERGLLRQNAPHLVTDLPFVVPNYEWWEAPFYGVGLKVYDLLAGRYGFGRSELLSRDETLARLPTIKTEGLRGGVVYYDGQFDDARLLINLAATAVEQGALTLNYTPATALTRDADGFVDGIVAHDLESGREFRAPARVVINAAGPQCDAVRRLVHADAAPLIAPSQGIHLVFEGSFLPGGTAIMVPHTPTAASCSPSRGTATPLSARPTRQSAMSRWSRVHSRRKSSSSSKRRVATCGGRSHAATCSACSSASGRSCGRDRATNTASLSRDHTIHIDPSGLLTIAGGKWTTYRHMAEDCVDHAATLARLPEKPCVTRNLNVHGFHRQADGFGALAVYGSDALLIQDLIRADPSLAAPLHPALPCCGAEVVWAARVEMARTVEDVLARRTRALFLNARAAMAMAPETARLLARELGRDEAWQQEQVDAFRALAEGYVVSTTA